MTTKNNNKEYTFLNLKTSVGKNGNYTSCTAECLVTRVKEGKTATGKYCVSFMTPIKGRANAIEKMVGSRPVEDATGSVWTTVSFFDNEYNQLATRFMNYLAKREDKTIVLYVTGKISVDSREKDGRTYVNCNIIADDFDEKRAIPKKGNANAPSNNGYNSAPQQNAQANNPAPQNNSSAPMSQNQNGMPAANPAGYIPDGNYGFIAINDGNFNDDDIPF